MIMHVRKGLRKGYFDASHHGGGARCAAERWRVVAATTLVLSLFPADSVSCAGCGVPLLCDVLERIACWGITAFQKKEIPIASFFCGPPSGFLPK
jgi:hypothetical protein